VPFFIFFLLCPTKPSLFCFRRPANGVFTVTFAAATNANAAAAAAESIDYVVNGFIYRIIATAANVAGASPSPSISLEVMPQGAPTPPSISLVERGERKIRVTGG
jgi:hypothetical protein